MSDLPKFDTEDLKSYGDEEEELSLYVLICYDELYSCIILVGF